MKLKGPFHEEITFSSKFPRSLLGIKNGAYFVDQNLRGCFPFVETAFVKYVDAGEDAKTWESFQKNLSALVEKGHQKTNPIVVIGGGSLGDSVGFLASVYQRGVPLILVPSTWLSAVDSTLGGKTALNIGKKKNQIGSFYSPTRIHYVRELISTSSQEDGKGEILKTLFLNHNKAWAKQLLQRDSCWKISFSDLSHFIEYKSKIVKKDPYDSKGLRAVLNLGHTLGHIFELEFGVSHGSAVEAGLRFSLNWSHQKKLISEKNYLFLVDRVGVFPKFRSLTALESKLCSDKKSLSRSRINFIFLTNKGPIVEAVSFQSISKEFQRQVKLGLF